MLVIDDDILKAAGWTDEQARLEVAVALFRSGSLPLPMARKVSGLTKNDFESLLMERKIPLYEVTMDMLEEDMRTLDGLFGKA
jgi:predicted HTH domain antitoxin